MKHISKVLSFLFVVVCCALCWSTPISARTLSVVQPRAIRYDFDTNNMAALLGRYQKVEYPLSDDGTMLTRFKYIRVRIEKGSYGSFTINAIGSSLGEKTTISPETNVYNDSYIIDFKAKNAPVRGDANVTVNCSQPASYPGTLVSDDYCVSNPNGYYGIQIANHSWGASRAVGAFSFEN